MEERNFSVYKHTSPNKKVYIGITKNTERRWKKGNGYIGNKYFYRTIQKYGWHNIKHEILFENLTEEEAKLMEQMYIALFNSHNPNYGYNLTLGGDGIKGYRFNEKEKEKISNSISNKWKDESYRNHMINAHKGQNAWNKGLKNIYKHTDETKKKMSKARKGKHHITDEGKERIRVANTGRIMKEETKQKLRDANIGKKHTQETKNKMSESRKGKKYPERKGKKVICINTGKIYNRAKDAGIELNSCPSSIIKCCKGKRNSCGKINGEPARWMYYEDYLKQI